jgi:hypothetical protein
MLGEHLAIVKYLAPPGTKLNRWTINLALESPPEIAAYVLAVRDDLDWVALLLDAAEEGSTSAVSYLLQAHHYSPAEINQAGQLVRWDHPSGGNKEIAALLKAEHPAPQKQ